MPADVFDAALDFEADHLAQGHAAGERQALFFAASLPLFTAAPRTELGYWRATRRATRWA
jgi:hypothetical protein